MADVVALLAMARACDYASLAVADWVDEIDHVGVAAESVPFEIGEVFEVAHSVKMAAHIGAPCTLTRFRNRRGRVVEVFVGAKAWEKRLEVAHVALVAVQDSDGYAGGIELVLPSAL